MDDAALPLTQDLAAAVTEVLGATLDNYDPVVTLAYYIDSLAKGYGLSESLDLDTDPLESVLQTLEVQDVIEHFLSDGSRLDAEAVRSRVYDAAVVLAGDPQVRRMLNQNRHMTEADVLHLVQVYWNLEATDARHRLPLKSDGHRDIPIPEIVGGDFATMLWTSRVNHKGYYKASGQGFRKQGARMSALIARHLAQQVGRAPSPTRSLTMTPTKDLAEPVEITLRALVEERANAAEYADAYALSTSYVDIITRRAELQPFELEADLADAFLMRGILSGAVTPVEWSSGERGNQTVEDLEKAATSYETQVLLDPENDDLLERAATSWSLLGWAYSQHARHGDAAEAFTRVVSYTEQRTATRPQDRSRLLLLVRMLGEARTALRDAGRLGEAVAIARRTVAETKKLSETATGSEADINHDPTSLMADALLNLSESLRDVGLFEDGERAAHQVLTLGSPQELSPFTPRVYLAVALSRSAAGDPSSAADAMKIVVEHFDNASLSNPPDAKAHLLAVLMLAREYHEADRLDEAYAADRRAIEMSRTIPLEEPLKSRLKLSKLRCIEKLLSDEEWYAALELMETFETDE